MKKIPFTKMSGAGNDFLVIEAKKGLSYRKLAQRCCHRTEGLGADGLLVLDKSRRADFAMRIFNADGSEAEMCGNGVRCLAAYIRAKKKTKKETINVETKAGVILTQVRNRIARVRLSDPKDFTPDIPLTVNNRKIRVHYIDTGVPHVVVFVDRIEQIDVPSIGRTIRRHKRFAPRGTNVNFVEQLSSNRIAIRTYERGVEGETKSCGTGSAAAALIAQAKSLGDAKIKRGISYRVVTHNGDVLKIHFDKQNGEFTDVWLSGQVRWIADGNFFL